MIIETTTMSGKTVYIMVNQIIHIVASGASCYIYTLGGQEFSSRESAETIVKKIKDSVKV